MDSEKSTANFLFVITAPTFFFRVQHRNKKQEAKNMIWTQLQKEGDPYGLPHMV